MSLYHKSNAKGIEAFIGITKPIILTTIKKRHDIEWKFDEYSSSAIRVEGEVIILHITDYC